MGGVSRHARHHGRFYIALLAGLAAWLVLPVAEGSLRLLIAGDVFYAIYLASTFVSLFNAEASHLRRRAAVADEGAWLIAIVTVAAIVLNLGSMFVFVNQQHGADLPYALISIAGVPLGWLTMHTVMALHYAHRFYERAGGKGGAHDVGGLAFPGTEEPDVRDFLYFSFVVGMTAQVSDVQVTDSRMRWLTLVHGVVSFFYNTVILALAVNVAAGWGR